MGRFCLLRALLFLILLTLSSFHGHGRKLMETSQMLDSSVRVEEPKGGKSSLPVDVTEDYQLDPGPNTNPEAGFTLPPPPRR